MTFPITRMRRLRGTKRIRNLVSETHIHIDQLVLPLFFDEGISSERVTDSMPGVATHPLSDYESLVNRIEESGLGSVIVFGIPRNKDSVGTEAYAKDGVSQKAISGLRENSDLCVIADLCLCEYTNHGNCGILCEDGGISNDDTLEQYAKCAVAQAEAGANIIAPSGMMDGQVAALRTALDDAGFKDVMVMAYSSKFFSSYYGPFRDVVFSAPQRNDRSVHQIPCGNRREALREIALDIEEGADIVMIKPAGPYLDVIREARCSFELPIAAYQVSGEYNMIKAAAERGWINEDCAVMESILGIRRAGADIVITYYADKIANMLRGRS